MGFLNVSDQEKKYQVKKQLELNEEGFVPKYTLMDGQRVSPFFFACVNCEGSSTNLTYTDALYHGKVKHYIPVDSLGPVGGTGTSFKIIQCDQCHSNYYVGIGYMEPNYGRDVHLLHTIVELDEEAF